MDIMFGFKVIFILIALAIFIRTLFWAKGRIPSSKEGFWWTVLIFGFFITLLITTVIIAITT